MWTAGAFYVVTPAATSGVCERVCVCACGCAWRILPHVGGGPAVPILTRLVSVLQTLSCHSGLPGAHLTDKRRDTGLHRCRGATSVCVCVRLGMLIRACMRPCLCSSENLCVCVWKRVHACPRGRGSSLHTSHEDTAGPVYVGQREEGF